MSRSCGLITLLLVLILSTNAITQTYISGSLNGILTSGTYIVDGNIFVTNGDTLVIEPGATFLFDGDYDFDINGYLFAVGTEFDSIKFMPDTGVVSWGGIDFTDNASDSCKLKYVLIKNSNSSGISCHYSSPTINHCRINNNSADNGGGIYCDHSSPIIKNCTISENNATAAHSEGGGINCYFSNPIISNCIIEWNSALKGGGIHITSASPEIEYCTIENNSAPDNWAYVWGDGGGIFIYNSQSNPTIRGCIIRDNWSKTRGGGIFLYDGASPIIINCTISNNDTEGSFDGSGGGICCHSSHPTIINTIVANNVRKSGIDFVNTCNASINFCDFSNNIDGNLIGNIPFGMGEIISTNINGDSCDTFYNIYIDPLFVNASGGDYHLQYNSPCIDAGDPSLPYDPDGTISDIGVYYYYQSGVQFNLVITEILQNPSQVLDTQGEWFEIANFGSNTINLYGWKIKDNGSDNHVISSSLPVQVGQYVVLGINSDSLTNGGVNIDYQYSNITLGNGSDELILISPTDSTVDSVAWDNGATFPDPNGASMALLDPALDNSLGTNWTTSTTLFGNGDFGTPGSPNFAGEIELSTTNIVFDTTYVGSQTADTVIVYNRGLGLLTIDSIYTNHFAFSPSISSAAIGVGDSVLVEVVFTPNDCGWYYAWLYDSLIIVSDDYDNLTSVVDLSGFGIEISSRIETNSTSLNFPDVMVGLNQGLSLEIANIGNSSLEIINIFTGDPAFTISFSDTSVAIGDTISLIVNFEPSATQSYYSNLSIVSNDPYADTVLINLQGDGIEPNPNIYVNSDSLIFGNIAAGDTAQLEFTIKNVGVEDLEVEEIYFGLGVASPFWTEFEDATLSPTDSVIITVFYSYSNNRALLEDILYILSNDPDEGLYEIILTARTQIILRVPESYATIQAAINAAENGDQVLVSPGIYNENINFFGKKIMVKSASGPEVTIIDAGNSGIVVKFVNSEDSTSILQGFTIQNASDFSYYGAGIECGASSPKIINNIIQNNSCRMGGISVYSNCSPIIKNNIIRGNIASTWGGAISCDANGNAIIIGNLIYDNWAQSHGQGIRCWSCNNVQIINNTIVLHTRTGGSWNGGVIESDAGSNLLIKNNIIAYNQVGIQCTWGGAVNISYNNVWNNGTNYNSCSAGTGDISLDPLFADTSNFDFRITWANFPVEDNTKSPCIDAGDPTRPQDPDSTIADMGAYYFHQSYFQKIVDAGWNLLGLPSYVNNYHYKAIFPNAIDGTLYGYNGSYQQLDSMVLGAGYWLNFTASDTINIKKYPVDSLTINLRQGWNMISGISCNLALTEVIDPDTIIVPGTLYEFEGVYAPSDSIKESIGYWINASDSGQITLTLNPPLFFNLTRRFAKKLDLSQSPVLMVSDQTRAVQKLFFNIEIKNAHYKQYYSLPPLPPAGAFDARFTEDFRICEGNEAIIQIQSSSYPVIVSPSNLPKADGFQYVIKEMIPGKEPMEHLLKEGASIQITNPQVKSLKLEKRKVVLLKFSVNQNYPNPFNPETEIRYSIPGREKVEIVIYNSLGQKIRTLVSQYQDAGHYTAVWDGTNDTGRRVGSGIFFYRIKAGKYSVVKKMVLLK